MRTVDLTPPVTESGGDAALSRAPTLSPISILRPYEPSGLCHFDFRSFA